MLGALVTGRNTVTSPREPLTSPSRHPSRVCG
jgi:hypothetical protein